MTASDHRSILTYLEQWHAFISHSFKTVRKKLGQLESETMNCLNNRYTNIAKRNRKELSKSFNLMGSWEVSDNKLLLAILANKFLDYRFLFFVGKD